MYSSKVILAVCGAMVIAASHVAAQSNGALRITGASGQEDLPIRASDAEGNEFACRETSGASLECAPIGSSQGVVATALGSGAQLGVILSALTLFTVAASQSDSATKTAD